MVCEINKLDSNTTSLAIAKEECLKQLPASPVWQNMEPNSYADFGAEVNTVARAPIEPTRQSLKGTITGINATAGFNTDLTKTNLIDLMQGFMFADAVQQPSTEPLNGTRIAITGVDASTGYAAASGLAVFAANDLLLASGFANSGNNGLKTVVTATTTAIDVSEPTFTEAAPANGKLDRVGHVFAAADVALTIVNGVTTLTATAGTFNTYGLKAGQWIFLGGDTTASQLGANIGFARIDTIAAKTLTFDQTTFTPVANVGTGVSLAMFFGVSINNATTYELIVRRSYQLERTLGSIGTGVQSEYVTGAVPNELTFNIPTEDKINVDLGFVGLDYETRDGATGRKAGTRLPAKGEQAYNTSSDVYKTKMYINGQINPLFGYISESDLTIANNVTALKAIGSVGGFDVGVGNFDVTGSVTAFFTDVAAIQAIRNHADVGVYTIVSANNGGFLYDIPLLALASNSLNIEKDTPITLPLESTAFKSKFGYTLMVQFFVYLPNVAQL